MISRFSESWRASCPGARALRATLRSAASWFVRRKLYLRGGVVAEACVPACRRSRDIAPKSPRDTRRLKGARAADALRGRSGSDVAADCESSDRGVGDHGGSIEAAPSSPVRRDRFALARAGPQWLRAFRDTAPTLGQLQAESAVARATNGIARCRTCRELVAPMVRTNRDGCWVRARHFGRRCKTRKPFSFSF